MFTILLDKERRNFLFAQCVSAAAICMDLVLLFSFFITRPHTAEQFYKVKKTPL